MTDDKLDHLQNKLNSLLKRQEDFSREIDDLRIEIDRFKFEEAKQSHVRGRIVSQQKKSGEGNQPAAPVPPAAPQSTPLKKQHIQSAHQSVHKKSDLEKFIGENLINKIGIAITIIGVSIGVKYTIDHDLISPLTRIILGYLAGIGLLGIGIKLKKRYEDFSAVLVSGAMAILFFITYAAYSFYALIPQSFTFIMMVLFTIFTVLAAISYNKQVIAHIGLVGAYAVPFLLSDSPEKAGILFSYMAIINAGILIIAFRKYWKLLYYASFVLTWLIFFSWYSSAYQTNEDFALGVTFTSIFFTLFYLTFLSYKLIRKEKFNLLDILLLLSNSFIFYGIGYTLIDNYQAEEQLLGLFTLANAIIHFIVATIIYRQKLADSNLFYLVSGLVLVFITIAVPVQLDGSWVTLLWVGEAALLFWIGKTKQIPIYEKLAYPLMFLAFFSIIQDWGTVYNQYDPERPETIITPLLNIHFLTSLLFIAAFGFINYLHYDKKYPGMLAPHKGISQIISLSIPAILVFTLYFAFRMEIANFWDQLYGGSVISVNSGEEMYTNTYWNRDLKRYKTIWLINYSLLFFSILSFLNISKLKNRKLGRINLGFNVFNLVTFLLVGLYALSALRESYIEQTLSQYYERGVFNLGIRYISFLFVAMVLYSCYRYIQQDFMKSDFKVAFATLLHLTILWIASSELISWMDLAESTQSYKLGLSILWGFYALLLIVLGIWKNKKYLRIGAIVLFGVTLTKLFFYDISHLDTISKTILFVSLGILLLTISFLYNKYKHLIANETKN